MGRFHLEVTLRSDDPTRDNFNFSRAMKVDLERIEKPLVADIDAMRARDTRRRTIASGALALAQEIADTLNDADGWAGERRRDIAEQAVNRSRTL